MLSCEVPSELLPSRQSFTTRRPSSLTRHGWIRLSPIVQYSPLLPPVGVWTVSRSSVADRPLRPATHRTLGEPLPHQLGLNNGPQADPLAINLSSLRTYGALIRVSSGYSPPEGTLPTCYSPVRRSTPKGDARLACVRPAASVRSEPGSNSPV